MQINNHPTGILVFTMSWLIAGSKPKVMKVKIKVVVSLIIS